jgi:glycogen synthase
MNIGLLCNELPPAPTGGIGTFTTDLIRGLNEFGHGVHLVSLDRKIHSDDCEVVSPKLTIHRLAAGEGRIRGYLNRLKLFLFIRKLAEERQIDLIELPDFEGWCAGWTQLRVPVVVRLHGSATYFAAEMKAPIAASVKLMERLAIQRADHVVSVSRYTADRSKEVFGLPLRPTIIRNSIVLPDPARVKTDFRSQDLVCYSGTLIEKKGVFSLSRAWPLVKKRRPNARLLMIGKDGTHGGGSSMERIRDLAGSDAESIIFTGHLPKPEMEVLLTTADVAVYPSYSEAFALAPMEAMALCVPTIYTTRASGRELIQQDVNGWLCDPDRIDELANQIVFLLEDETLRRKLGQAGRQRISDGCSYTKALRSNINFYERCINEVRKTFRILERLST